MDCMTTGPNNYAERAASAFNRRDVEAMLALVCEDFIYLDSMGIQNRSRSHAQTRDRIARSVFPMPK